MASSEAKVRLDLNNPVFQDNLLTLQKPERHAALDMLHKIRQLTWQQLHRDPGLKWERITSVRPHQGIDAIYSLRITPPMATPNCSTYGRSNCSRQDERIMRVRV